MRNLVFAFVALAMSACGSLSPVAAQECTPVEMVAGNLIVHPMTAEVHIATPAEVKLALEIINAMPPETNFDFDTMIFATAHTGQGLVLVGHSGICQQVAFPPREWSAFLRSVRGAGA